MSPTRVFLFLSVRLFRRHAILACVTTAAVSQDAPPASRAEPKPIILRAESVSLTASRGNLTTRE